MTDRSPDPDQRPRRRGVLVPAVVATVAAVVALALLVGPRLTSDDSSGDDVAADTDAGSPSAGQSGGQSGGQSDNRAPDSTWQQLVRRDDGDPMAMGDVDAPVVMIAYSEFQCPFCGKFARDTEPTLVHEYVDDGTLRIEWRDFPYLGPESMTAARAGRAAAAQGRFWDFHDAMYAHQLPPNSGKLDEDYVRGVAEDLGLDVDRFLADMADPASKKAVEQDFSEGQAIGVTGTPTFVINGIPIVGAQPLSAFEDVIDRAAAEAGK